MEPGSGKVKLTKVDHRIAGQETNLFQKWLSLEQNNRRSDRFSQPAFQRRHDQFIADLEVPFIVTEADGRRSDFTPLHIPQLPVVPLLLAEVAGPGTAHLLPAQLVLQVMSIFFSVIYVPSSG